VITTNLNFSEQVNVFGEAKMTTALLGRLTHRVTLLNFAIGVGASSSPKQAIKTQINQKGKEQKTQNS
jgi:hypothetical protein